MNPFVFFATMLKASLFSVSGAGNIPILHQDLLARGWATEQHFAESLSIGQISPGPTGLWVISLGYLLDGLRGALLALAAIAIPPLLVLPIHGLYRRIGGHSATEGFVRGLTLAVTGIFGMVLSGILFRTGVSALSLAIVLGAMIVGATRRVPVIVVLALAAVVGVVLF